MVFMFTGCSSRGANVNIGSTYTSNNTDESVLLLLDAIGTPLPELLSDQQIAAMSEAELRVAISDVAEALDRIGNRNEEAKTRLRKEFHLLLDRLKDLQNARRKN